MKILATALLSILCIAILISIGCGYYKLWIISTTTFDLIFNISFATIILLLVFAICFGELIFNSFNDD